MIDKRKNVQTTLPAHRRPLPYSSKIVRHWALELAPFSKFFSSPEPSTVSPFTISNDFSSETTGPIVIQFHLQPPGPSGQKICSNGLGHMTRMAAMPIYCKNFKKSSSPEPID